jgi:hypothetical protein
MPLEEGIRGSNPGSIKEEDEMKRIYEVTLKRMTKDGPEGWVIEVPASNPTQAKLLASARMRREKGITDCTWTVTRCRAIATARENIFDHTLKLETLRS